MVALCYITNITFLFHFNNNVRFFTILSKKNTKDMCIQQIHNVFCFFLKSTRTIFRAHFSNISNNNSVYLVYRGTLNKSSKLLISLNVCAYIGLFLN